MKKDIKIDYMSPREILSMTIEDYIRMYGDSTANLHLLSVIYNRLNTHGRQMCESCLGSFAKSDFQKSIKIWDLIRIPIEVLRHTGLGFKSIGYIEYVLDKNDLCLGMTDRQVDKYIVDYDINNAMLRTVLERLCNQCIAENRKEIMRTFDNSKEILPGFICCVMVTKNPFKL